MRKVLIVFCLSMACFFLMLIIALVQLPRPLLNPSYATLLLDRQGEVLGGSIAEDGQWRFAPTYALSNKFTTCLIAFEDRHFYRHVGVNPASILRAVGHNVTTKGKRQGGSTLTMQLARISYGQSHRNILQKIAEILRAMAIELIYSKEEILRSYSAHAPFGGNVVGVEAASWRYFGHRSFELSWAESALLAVLPNAPGLLFPGKNSAKLLEKRNRLLNILRIQGTIDSLTYQLALDEPLPERAIALPSLSPHLLARAKKEGKSGQVIQSTLHASLQAQILEVMEYFRPLYQSNGIENAAVLVLDVASGEVMAYAGNLSGVAGAKSSAVDLIMAPRSTGSTLKPLLYAAALAEGLITPEMLLADVPTYLHGYTPKNHSLGYDGAVKARRAISRSLNVPAVRLLNVMGVGRFLQYLQKLGFHSMQKSPSHYGLSLVLGGAEASLWEMCSVYRQLAAGMQGADSVAKVHYDQSDHQLYAYPSIFPPAVIYEMAEAMSEVARPDEENMWQNFQSGKKVAWKTGTSFGNRDAWSVGMTAQWVVGVWVGNANGQGRALLTGIGSAAPLMFQVIQKLPEAQWFKRPVWGWKKFSLCKQSGHMASALCPEAVQATLPDIAYKVENCPYHIRILTDELRRWRLHQGCADHTASLSEIYFELPPDMAHYYMRRHSWYVPAPPYRADCLDESADALHILYPQANAKIYLAKGFTNQTMPLVLEAICKQTDEPLFWHLNDAYLGQTQQNHQWPVKLSKGQHHLKVMMRNGQSKELTFQILSKE